MYLICSSLLATLLLVVPGSYSTPWSEKKTSYSYQPAAVSYSPAQHYFLSYGSSSDGAYRLASGNNGDSSESGETKTISYKFATPAVTYAAAPLPVAPVAPVVQHQVSYVTPAKQTSSHSSVYHYQQAAPAPAAYYVSSGSAAGYSHKKQKKQKITYNLATASRYGDASSEKFDHLEAHRKAVEEHQRAHAEALRRLDEARRLHKAAGGSDDSDSGEKRAYGVPQKVKFHVAAPAVSHGVYTGPQVSRAETEALHADAIAKQKQLIAQQEAINAAGPAKMNMDWTRDDSSDDDSKSGETYYYHPAPVVHVKPAVQKTYYTPAVPAVQEVTYQYYQQKPYDGPLVSRAETEYLHRDAIAKQQAIIRQQAALISGVRAGSGSGSGDNSDSGEDAQTKAADDAQARQDQANEQALLARQEAEVQAQTLLAKQQGEQAKVSGLIEGAWRGDDSGEASSGGSFVSYAQKAYSDDGSDSGEAIKKQYFVPVYEAPVQVGYAYQPVAHTATIYKQKDESQEVYNGPKVTKEETERLHADAIAKQKAIIAQHEAFISRQRSALETRYSYQKHYAKADSSDSDSGESGSKGGYYAAHYYTAPTPVAPATVNVIGPKVTNYLSGYSPAAFYAGAKQTSYVVPSSGGGVYRAGSSDDDSGESGVYKLKEAAQLAQQDAEVRKQIEIAKAQGAAAAAEGSYYRAWSKDDSDEKATVVSSSYVAAKPAVVKNPGQYVYYRYARPTFGYYVEEPATIQKQVVVQHHQPAPIVHYHQPQVQQHYVAAAPAVYTTVQKSGKSESDENAW